MVSAALVVEKEVEDKEIATAELHADKSEFFPARSGASNPVLLPLKRTDAKKACSGGSCGRACGSSSSKKI